MASLKTIPVCLFMLGLDVVWKMVVLFFYLFPAISYSNIPGFYKGIQYPELQFTTMIILLLIMGIVLYFFRKPNVLTIRHLKWLTFICFGVGIGLLILSQLYSANVIQTNPVLFFLPLVFKSRTEEIKLGKV